MQQYSIHCLMDDVVVCVIKTPLELITPVFTNLIYASGIIHARKERSFCRCAYRRPGQEKRREPFIGGDRNNSSFLKNCKGCDASILISGATAERSALQNSGLRGFEVIDDAKSQLEVACPGVVSCADIVALAARDSVDLTGGPSWSVPLGRRDGRTSSASEAMSLPSPADSVGVQRQKFADKGLNDQDLVTLVGGHTIGQTDCLFFRYRLYNFTTTGNADPTINQAFLAQLQALCPSNGDASKRVALDTGSMTQFDVSYFKNVKNGQGVLESDQRLWEDATTQAIVKKYAGTIVGLLGLRFDFEFPKSMVKMSSIGVKTGGQGEIRKICSRFN